MKKHKLKPWWQMDGDLSSGLILYLGDVIKTLKRIPSETVHCVVTSPPYWGMRDYAVCICVASGVANPKCRICSGSGTDPGMVNQIGNEKMYQGYVQKMVDVFHEIHRVLRDDGTLWLNLGDTYASSKPGRADVTRMYPGQSSDDGCSLRQNNSQLRCKTGFKLGNLVGIPWRVAFALQDDGWILRSDVPWVKRTPIPESTKNRPAKTLEYVFMLVKKRGYYFDLEAVKKPSSRTSEQLIKSGNKGLPYIQQKARGIPEEKMSGNARPGSVTRTGDFRNFWNSDLWFESVDKPHGLVGMDDELVGLDPKQGRFAGAHFATFPVSLVKPLILASTSRKGCCVECGSPWKRILERTPLKRKRPNDYVKYVKDHEKSQNTPGKLPYSDKSTLRMNTYANSVAGVNTKTIGWEPTCECGTKAVKPCVVMDPFCGSGTVGLVCQRSNRSFIGIDLSKQSLQIAKVRLESRGCVIREKKNEDKDSYFGV